MARTVSVVPTTRVGKALESHRTAAKLTRREVIRQAGTSEVQYLRWLTEDRQFKAEPVIRAARAVGLDVVAAVEAIGIVVVPPGMRVVRTAEEVDPEVVEDMGRIGILAVPPGVRVMTLEEVTGSEETRLRTG